MTVPIQYMSRAPSCFHCVTLGSRYPLHRYLVWALYVEGSGSSAKLLGFELREIMRVGLTVTSIKSIKRKSLMVIMISNDPGTWTP